MIRRLEHDVEGYDLCIVGAGPAGLTIASELAYTGLKICVLESGAEKRTDLADRLKQAQSPLLPIKPDSRERLLGGGTTVWGGLSAPLDPIDLEPRAWCEGWPLRAEEMEPFLSEAQRYRFPAPSEFSHDGEHLVDLGELKQKKFIAVTPAHDFSRSRAIFGRKGVDLFLKATAVQLVAEDGRIREVLCRTPEGTSVRVRARTFILASGGIENPRLLLHSDVGNEHDQVGRYFMNHPKGRSGRLRLSKALPADTPYLPHSANGRIAYTSLTLPESEQRSSGLLNSCVQLESDARSWRRYLFALRRRLPAFAPFLSALLRPRTLCLRWFADMEPRAENRIRLEEKKDAFGVPFPVVTYELGARDKETLRVLHQRLREEVQRSGLGVIEGDADSAIAAIMQDASHHLGGTRMGRDPRTSVVDPDCKVHSMANLYVAGGSVFSTGGCANPTYTITALAIRLAAHLKRSLGGVDEHVPQNQEGVGIVVAGAGRRVAEDIVPALESLEREFRIDGIFARHSGMVFGRRSRYEVRPIGDISEHVGQARFVYVAVPSGLLTNVLRQMPHVPKDTELIIDTPVSLTPSLLRECARWKRVHVAEDSVFLPWLSLLRSKHIRRVDSAHALFRYHGIALLKAIARREVRFAWGFRKRFWIRVGSIRARLIEPRDYARGTLRFDGEEIVLSVQGNTCEGFRCGDTFAELSSEEAALAGYMEAGDSIVSRMPELKRVGLRRLLLAAYRDEPTWTLTQASNDAAVDALVHRFGIYARMKL